MADRTSGWRKVTVGPDVDQAVVFGWLRIVERRSQTLNSLLQECGGTGRLRRSHLQHCLCD